MAAVTRGEVRIATGFEGAHVERGMALVVIQAGDPVNVSTTAVDTRYDFAVEKASGSDAYFDGIALHSAQPNRKLEFLRRGEVEGFVGLDPGTSLSLVDGDIDTTEPDEGPLFLRISTPNRIVKLY